MKAPAQTLQTAGRLPALDGLRAIAILLVLAFHSLAHVPVAWVRAVSAPGWVGVDLFFVLSGFLIGGILLDQGGATNYYRVFYARRFFRIVPLYALLVIPGLLVLGLGGQRLFAGHSLGDHPTPALWYCPFFLQNVAVAVKLILPNYLVPTWSVAVEEQFYLVLPLFLRLVTRSWRLPLLAVGIVAAPLLRGALLARFGEAAGEACYVLLPCRWDALLLGVVAAVLWRDARFRRWAGDQRGWLHGAFGLLAAASVALFWPGGSRLDPPMSFWGYTVIDVWFTVTLLLAVLPGHERLQGWLSAPVFKPIATGSYGLYLLHSPMLAVVEAVYHRAQVYYPVVSWTAVGAVTLSLVATAGAATISWKYLESRCLQMGHRHRFEPGGR